MKNFMWTWILSSRSLCFSKDGERILKKKELEVELARKNFRGSSSSLNRQENSIKATEVRKVGGCVWNKERSAVWLGNISWIDKRDKA